MSKESLFSSVGGTGSIWDYFNEYGGGSAVEKLIEKEDTKFIDVISHDGLVQELKSSNAKVITYLCDENKIDVLLKYFFVEEEYLEDDEEKYVYKFPHLVMEILTCELSEFNRIFMETDRLYKHFFAFLLEYVPENVKNRGLIYYYIRAYNHFVEKNYIHCLEFFFRYLEENKVDNEEFLEKYFLNHFGIFQFERFFLSYLGLFIKENELGAMIVGSIGADENRSALASIFGSNALAKLGSGRRSLMRRGAFNEEKRKKTEKQKELRSKFAGWLRSCEILKLMLNRFNPDMKDTEGYSGDDVDYVRAVFQLLTIIVEHNDKFPELFDYLVVENFGSTLTFFFTRAEGSEELRVSKPVFIHGIRYLGSVLKHITTKYFVNVDKLESLSAISPEREGMEAAKEKLGACLTKLQKGVADFVLPYLRHECDDPSKRIGEAELACVDYIVLCMKSLDTAQVESSEHYCEFLKWCIQNYEKYPFHNFFHTKVMNLFEHFFLNVSDERWIGEHIIKKTGLLEFVITSVKKQEAPTVMQMGYIGHCFKYSQEIKKLKEAMTIKAVGKDISGEPFMKYLKEANWESFETEILTPKFENYQKHLGGVDVKNSFLFGGGSRDDDDSSDTSSDTTSSSSDSDTDSDSDDEVVVKGDVDSSSDSSSSSDFSSDSSDDEMVIRKDEEGPMGEGPMGEGPMGEGPMGEGPMGEGPMGEGPMGEGPMGEGPMGEGPVAPSVDSIEPEKKVGSAPVRKKTTKIILSDDSDTDSSDSDFDEEEDVK